MLRSVVSARAANMMLVRCWFDAVSDVPISLACSTKIGNSPDLGIIGTALGDLAGLWPSRQLRELQFVKCLAG
jgi:hypothetical protein